MGVEVTTRPASADAIVVTVAGTADEGLLMRLADGIALLLDDGVDVVLQCNELVLASARAVRGLVARLAEHPRHAAIAFACGRLSGRRVLRLVGGGELAIFATVDEALQGLRARPQALHASIAN